MASILGANILEEIHNHHNFAWKEAHQGRDLWVVRKGATPAFPGQKGFVGGSMGDVSVIIEGVESGEGTAALYSTVHGAGRVLGRREAAGKYKFRAGKKEKVSEGKITSSFRDAGPFFAGGKKEKVSEGKITRQMLLDWITPLGVELRGAGTDESPHCYKRLPDVLGYHAESIRVLHTLTPIGVAMAGEYEFDPFKD